MEEKAKFGWKEFIVFIFFSLVKNFSFKGAKLQAKELIDDSESLLLNQKYFPQKGKNNRNKKRRR